MNSLVLKLLGTTDGPKVRGQIYEGIEQYSVYDFVTAACAYKDTGAAARKEFKRLTSPGAEHAQEIVATCHSLRFPGQRGPGTPCMTIRGLRSVIQNSV